MARKVSSPGHSELKVRIAGRFGTKVFCRPCLLLSTTLSQGENQRLLVAGRPACRETSPLLARLVPVICGPLPAFVRPQRHVDFMPYISTTVVVFVAFSAPNGLWIFLAWLPPTSRVYHLFLSEPLYLSSSRLSRCRRSRRPSRLSVSTVFVHLKGYLGIRPRRGHCSRSSHGRVEHFGNKVILYYVHFSLLQWATTYIEHLYPYLRN